MDRYPGQRRQHTTTPTPSSPSSPRRNALRGKSWRCRWWSFLLTVVVATTAIAAVAANAEPLRDFPSGYKPSYWRNHLIDDIVDDGGDGDGDDGDDDETNKSTKNHRQHLLRNRFFALRHGRSEANVAGVIASDPETACENYGLSSPIGFDQAKAAGAKLVADFLEARGKRPWWKRGGRSRFSKPRGILVVTSDFKRAYETARCVCAAVAEHNGNHPDEAIPLYSWSSSSGSVVPIAGGTPTEEAMTPGTHVALRERWFGEWDGRPDVHYKDVWKDDALDPYHTVRGVESVYSVLDRATRMVRSIDNEVTGGGCLNGGGDNDDEEDEGGCLWIICVAHGDVLQILQTAFGKNPIDPSHHRSLDHLETATLRPFE